MTENMEDNLENFVRENRNEFDTLVPKEKVWESVQKEIESSRPNSNTMVIWRAAAIILFIFSVGIVFYINKDAVLSTSPKVVFDEEFLKTESYYTSVINERRGLVELVVNDYPSMQNDFEQDWKLLDQSYLELKNEYKKHQSEEVLNALIQNLQTRVSLLSMQIEILETIDSDNKIILEI